MLKKLEEAKNNKQLLEIYRNLDDTGKFSVAKVLKATENYTIIANFSPVGLYGGFSLIETERIYQINKNTRYIKNIEKLYKAKNQNHNKFDVENEDLILGFLEAAKQQESVVSVELLEEAVIQGFVKNVEEDIVIVASLTTDGELDGETFFKKEDITCIHCDDQEANTLKILYSSINKNN